MTDDRLRFKLLYITSDLSCWMAHFYITVLFAVKYNSFEVLICCYSWYLSMAVRAWRLQLLFIQVNTWFLSSSMISQFLIHPSKLTFYQHLEKARSFKSAISSSLVCRYCCCIDIVVAPWLSGSRLVTKMLVESNIQINIKIIESAWVY